MFYRLPSPYNTRYNATSASLLTALTPLSLKSSESSTPPSAPPQLPPPLSPPPLQLPPPPPSLKQAASRQVSQQFSSSFSLPSSSTVTTTTTASTIGTVEAIDALVAIDDFTTNDNVPSLPQLSPPPSPQPPPPAAAVVLPVSQSVEIVSKCQSIASPFLLQTMDSTTIVTTASPLFVDGDGNGGCFNRVEDSTTHCNKNSISTFKEDSIAIDRRSNDNDNNNCRSSNSGSRSSNNSNCSSSNSGSNNNNCRSGNNSDSNNGRSHSVSMQHQSVQKINCLFPFLSLKKIRLSSFDLYSWIHLKFLLEDYITPEPFDSKSPNLEQFFILFSQNKWILVIRQKYIQILVDNGFFFNRAQNVITCYYCGIIYMFTNTYLTHTLGCCFNNIAFVNNPMYFIRVNGINLKLLYPVYNISNWNDSFDKLRYGNNSILNGVQEYLFTAHTTNFLINVNNNHKIVVNNDNISNINNNSVSNSIGSHLIYYETLKRFANFLSLKYNFYREACNNVDVFLRQTSHRISPLVKVETFNNNNDILDTFNYPTCGIFSGRVKLECPICLANLVTHILTCGHLFCQSCITKSYNINPNVCLYCRTKLNLMPIKIMFSSLM